ncbi:MAG: spore coat U domain-containing protein [Desulfuromonadales bacterium]|nr:spore coat U domain-containing protein [Desulfuromonadales bacterium]
MNLSRVAVLLMLLPMLPSPIALAINCTIVTAGFNFGNYDTFSDVPLDSAASISVTCNNPVKGPKKQPVPVMLTLSPGNSGSFATRYMTPLSGGSDLLYYNLSTSPSHATVFGDGTGGSDMVTALVSKEAPLNAKIYGRIPAKQNVIAGSYSDLITVTVTW